MSRTIKFFALTLFIGLLCGMVIGGAMHEPWWYVLPISLVGGIAIGRVYARKE